MFGFGLGKPRSKLGKFLDRNNVRQNKLAEECDMSRTVINELAAGSNKRPPTKTTKKRIARGLKNLTGEEVSEDDLF